MSYADRVKQKRVLTPKNVVAARHLREKIAGRMQQITQCVTSQGFCNALFDAIIQNDTAQFVLSNQNLRALRVPIPPGANVDPRVSGDHGTQIGLLVRPVWFNCLYDVEPFNVDTVKRYSATHAKVHGVRNQ